MMFDCIIRKKLTVFDKFGSKFHKFIEELHFNPFCNYFPQMYVIEKPNNIGFCIR